jgi:XTP/dITP diphosphohydrolase
MAREFLAATGNAHKLGEFRAILEPLGVRILTPREVGGIPEVVEDGATFAANAILKARAIAAATGRTVIADDSGLEVLALGGAPGVLSARYAGPGASDAQRMDLLLQRLAPHTDRRARFVCVIAVASPDRLLGTVEGEILGTIAPAPRGAHGFGYDPLFVPTGEARTFAEMTGAEKDAISHRGRALRLAVEMPWFKQVLGD